MDGNGTLSLPSDLAIELTMTVTNEEYIYPFTLGEFNVGEKMEALYQEMVNVGSGSVCSSGSCQSTYNQTEQNN